MEMVKDGKLVWPTCPECGCRLDTNVLENGAEILVHFGQNLQTLTDARGCKCSSVAQGWWILGSKLLTLTLYRGA